MSAISAAEVIRFATSIHTSLINYQKNEVIALDCCKQIVATMAPDDAQDPVDGEHSTLPNQASRTTGMTTWEEEDQPHEILWRGRE